MYSVKKKEIKWKSTIERGENLKWGRGGEERNKITLKKQLHHRGIQGQWGFNFHSDGGRRL